MITHTKKIASDKIILEPNNPVGSVIWLHGLGADGSDFLSIVDELNLAIPLRFIFPHAPLRSVTINQNQTMRAWFDIYSLISEHPLDHQGINDSVNLVSEFINQEKQLNIPAEKIIIAGFSQGAMLALATALHYPEKLAGVIALSGYLLNAEKMLSDITVNKALPIFVAHGTDDFVLPYQLGAQSAKQLTAYGLPVSWHSYSMGHSVCQEEINDLRHWLIQLFQLF